MVSQDKSQNALSLQKKVEKHNPIFHVFRVTSYNKGNHESENTPITANIFS